MAVAAAGVLLAGCGGHGSASGAAGGGTPAATTGSASSAPAPSASDLARMRKLVDGADAAASAAEKDAAGDN